MRRDQDVLGRFCSGHQFPYFDFGNGELSGWIRFGRGQWNRTVLDLPTDSDAGTGVLPQAIRKGEHLRQSMATAYLMDAGMVHRSHHGNWLATKIDDLN